MAQWITRLPTEQKIPGSSPGGLGFLNLDSWARLYVNDFSAFPVPIHRPIAIIPCWSNLIPTSLLMGVILYRPTCMEAMAERTIHNLSD